MSKRKFGLSGTALKILACIFMFIDHFAAEVIYMGFGLDRITAINPAYFNLYMLARWIGRIAFPIFAFLIVEGFIHTRDSKKYTLRMIIWAIISQIPYNLAFGDKIYYTEKFLPTFIFGNVMWTFALALIMLHIIKLIEEKEFSSPIRYILSFVVIGIFFLIAEIIKCDRKGWGILVVGLFYIFRDARWKQMLTSVVSFYDQYKMSGIFPFLSLIPIGLYNGERGRDIKKFFYIFYPTHLLILFAIRRILF